MKVIDLLNKIAKGEAPETIFYMGATYDYDKECMDYEDVDTGDLFFDDRYNTQILNDEVEIIEEDKNITEVLEIELLGQCDNWLQSKTVNIKSDMELNPYILKVINKNFELLYNKQCDLIKELNKLKGKYE